MYPSYSKKEMLWACYRFPKPSVFEPQGRIRLIDHFHMTQAEHIFKYTHLPLITVPGTTPPPPLSLSLMVLIFHSFNVLLQCKWITSLLNNDLGGLAWFTWNNLKNHNRREILTERTDDHEVTIFQESVMSYWLRGVYHGDQTNLVRLNHHNEWLWGFIMCRLDKGTRRKKTLWLNLRLSEMHSHLLTDSKLVVKFTRWKQHSFHITINTTNR